MKANTVLFITRNYPPLVGGMERLAYQLSLEISRQRKCAIVGPRGAKRYAPAGVDVYECAANPFSLFFLSAIFRSIVASLKFRPDIVLAGSGTTAPIARAVAAISQCPYAVLVHGLDLVVDNHIYRSYFIPSIVASNKVVANSMNTRRIAVESGVGADKVCVVNPGVSEAGKSERNFREEYGLGARPLLLFIGRLVPRKGLAEFIKYSLPIIVKEIPDVIFVIAGSEPGQALMHGSGVLSEIRQLVTELNIDRNVLITGDLSDDLVEAAYASGDVFVFPVKNTPGDVEGFGMVALEAAIHGLPTVAFGVDGIPDAVSEGISGYLVEPGNYNQLAIKLCEVLSLDAHSSGLAVSCVEFAKKFSWARYGEEVLHALDDYER